MTVSNLKDLEKLINLCRKKGVEVVKIDNIEFRLSDSPPAKRIQTRTAKPHLNGLEALDPGPVEQVRIKTDELTPDQLLFWSAEGNEQ